MGNPIEFEENLVKILRRSILDDMFKDFDAPRRRWLRHVFEPVAWPSAHYFARIAATFDKYVEQSGLRTGMLRILPNFARGVQLSGLENIPRDGPLLVIANHPGACDSLAIAATLPREDLNIVAFGFPLLQRLPSASRYLLLASKDANTRFEVLRSAIRHLEKGGSLLIFPAGRVEPDPSLLPGAAQSIQTWSPSLELLLRKVPEARVLITIVSGVLSERFVFNPLVRIWKGQRDPQAVAETIQVAVQMLLPRIVQVFPRITYDLPASVEDLYRTGGESPLLQTIIQRAQLRLEQHTNLPALQQEILLDA